MKNKRFFKTERTILITFYKFRDYPTAKKLAKIAKISRSTLYRHHQTARNIPHDYEVYLLKIFEKIMHKLLSKKEIHIKAIFLRMLVFVSSNKDVFKALFDDGQKEIIKKMLDKLKIKIINEWRLSGDIDKMYNIYSNEILGVIEEWRSNNFSENNLELILNDIIYLTKMARIKLLPLNNFKVNPAGQK